MGGTIRPALPPEDRDVSASTRLAQTVDVTAKRPAVRKQMVSERNRLRLLQVGVARQVGIASRFRLDKQCPLQPPHQVDHLVERPSSPQTKIGCDLIVPASPVCIFAPAVEFGDPPLAAVWMSSSLTVK